MISRNIRTSHRDELLKKLEEIKQKEKEEIDTQQQLTPIVRIANSLEKIEKVLEFHALILMQGLIVEDKDSRQMGLFDE